MSSTITVKAGQSYPIEILIGERPGGQCGFQLLVEQDGVDYRKDGGETPSSPSSSWARLRWLRGRAARRNFSASMDLYGNLRLLWKKARGSLSRHHRLR